MHLKALAALAFVALASFTDAKPIKKPKKHIFPTKQVLDSSRNATSAIHFSGLACESTPTTGKITNHGGPIISGTVNVYLIWYGSWTSTQKNILTTLASNIGGSTYFNIEKTYGVTGPIKYVSSVSDNYSQGTSLSDDSLPLIVSNAITNLGLPADSNGVYFINTDSSVQETSGFCSEYCGFHTSDTISGKTLKYAFIGNPASCIDGCSPCNTNVSPNGDIGVDAMASILTHELMEAASDPLGTTWYDANGYENADKCAYTYGSTSKTSSGAYYNLNIGGLNYLIQQNWNANTNGCAKSA